MSKINEFISKFIIKDSNASCLSKAVSDAYSKFNGSSTGRNAIHKTLSEEFAKIGQVYKGFRLAEPVVVEPVIAEPVVVVEEKLSAYEKQCLLLKEKKIMMQERLAKEKADQEERLKEKKLIQNEKLTIMAAELKLESDLKLKLMDHEFAQKMTKINQDFMREENNKPRVITLLSNGFNPYLDLIGYGTNSSQLIDSSSLKKVIGYSQYDATNQRNLVIENIISEAVDDLSEDNLIYEGSDVREIKSIPAAKIPDLMESLELNSFAKDEVLGQVDEIKQAPLSKCSRVKLPKLDRLKLSQNPEVHDKSKNKKSYIKAANKLRIKDGEVVISCYCCDFESKLDSAAIHRCHNIPKSQNGDWSYDNIYLCCASCNQAMGNDMSVTEYKLSLYIKSE